MPVVDISQISSNWKILQARLKAGQNADKSLKRKRTSKDEPAPKVTKRARPVKAPKPRDNERTMGSMLSSESQALQEAAAQADLTEKHDISKSDLSAAYGDFSTLSRGDIINGGRHKTHKPGRYLAVDCEMVGTGPPPYRDDVLARVSIVNFLGEQVYDTYVRAPPGIEVKDYRTYVSGIKEEHMQEGVATPFAVVQKEVADMLDGRILIGHALHKDLQALQLNHPRRDTRDTSKHRTYRIESRGKAPALRTLAKHHLNVTIQTGAHSSVEDARATMMLYKKDKNAFEEHSKKTYGESRPTRRRTDEPIEDLSEEDVDEEDLDDEDDLDEDLDATEPTKKSKPKKKKKKQKKRTKR